MALQVKVGTLVANTSTGNQSVVGVGFQPKAVIFMSSDNSALASPVIHDEPIIGVAVSSSQQWAMGCISQDAQNVTNTQRSAHNDRCYYADAFVGVSMAWDFVSHDPDGFTFNIVDASVAGVIVGYIAIGGDDIEVAAGVTSVPTAGGTHAVTGVGFQPDAVMLGHIGRLTWPTVNSTNFIFCVGLMTDTDQAAFALADRDAVGDAQTNTYQRSDSATLEVFADAQQSRTSRLSLDADGFTLTINVSPPAVSQPTGWLALRGAQMKVGVETQRTSTGTKSTTGVGFQPQAIVFMGAKQLASTSVVDGDIYHALGATDGTSQFQTMGGSEDGVGTSDTARIMKDTICMGWANGSGTIVSEAELASFDSDGFTLDWTTADAVASEFIYWAFEASEPEPETILVPHLTVATVA